jgi:hypothetical protein
LKPRAQPAYTPVQARATTAHRLPPLTFLYKSPAAPVHRFALGFVILFVTPSAGPCGHRPAKKTSGPGTPANQSHALLAHHRKKIMNRRQIILTGLAAASAALISACAPMPPPRARHPAYLRAVSDLRAARFNLERRPGDPYVSSMEDTAVAEIDRAIDGARRAAWDDGRNPNARPPADQAMPRAGRLRQADEMLRRAHQDIAREEDNPGAQGIRNDILGHIDAAIRATDSAIRETEMRR